MEAATGSLYVGSPETVARRIASTARVLGLSRFDTKYSAGALFHEKLMHCIQLYGSQVIPLVRELLKDENATNQKKGGAPSSQRSGRRFAARKRFKKGR